MKDIDFDELDRAVGSVLAQSKAPQSDVPSETASVPTAEPAAPSTLIQPRPLLDLDQPTTAEPEPAPAVASESPVSTEGSVSAADQSSPTPPANTIATRPRGQFLDMVHPSADMRSRPTPPTPAPRLTLTPTPTATVNDIVAPPRSDSQSRPQPVDPPTLPPSSQQATTASVSEAPVNANIASQPSLATDKSNPSSPPVLTHQKPTVITPLDTTPNPIGASYSQSAFGGIAIPDSEQTEAPLTQRSEPPQVPFMPDARVEKRPLSAFVPTEETESLSSVDQTQVQEQITLQSPPSIEPLSPELSADVNSVEALDVLDDIYSYQDAEDEQDESNRPDERNSPTLSITAPVENQRIDTSDETIRQPLRPIEPSPQPIAQPTPASVPIAQPTATPITPSPIASSPFGTPTSISPQYQTSQPVPDEDLLHPLFDTDEYHQPLLQASHKKSRKNLFLIILLILFLLAVGGALGYAAYTLGI